MANNNTKRNRKNNGWGQKRGHALDTGKLRADSGKQPYKGARREAIKNGVVRE